MLSTLHLFVISTRYSYFVKGGLALTKIDVLDGFEKIQICTAYRWNDSIIQDMLAQLLNRSHS